MFFMGKVKQSLQIKSTRLSIGSNMLDQMEDTADRIKELRKALRLTQTDLGRAAGVTKQSVSQWERGLTRPERDALRMLQKSYLRINPEWIDSRIGEMQLELASTAVTTDLSLTSQSIPGSALKGALRTRFEDLAERLTDADVKLLLSLAERLAAQATVGGATMPAPTSAGLGRETRDFAPAPTQDSTHK